MIWVEFVLVYFDVRCPQARPTLMGGSDNSDAQIETVGYQAQGKSQEGPAKHGNHPEHIDVRSGC